MSTNLLDLAIKIGVDDQATDAIANIAGGALSVMDKLESAVNTAAKIGTVALGATTTGFAALTKASVDNYTEFEQLVGGVETLFKQSADAVKRYADNAYNSAGLSANDYMETVTSFSASLLQGLGGDTAAAAQYADTAITDMADNANKLGTAIESIQNAYQGFAKQNYTMLDNLKLGYGGTAAEMARLINDSGVLGDAITVTANTVNQVSFDKIIEAIHVVQTEMGITGTTAQEASGTIAGSVSAAQAAWQNFLTGLANEDADIGALSDTLVSSVATAADNILPRVQQAVLGILTAFGELTGVDMTGFVEAVSQGATKVIAFADEIGAAFESDGVAGVVDVLTSKFTALTGLDLAPAIDMVKGLAAAFMAVATEKIENIGNAISMILAPFAENKTEIIESVKQALEGLIGIFDGSDDRVSVIERIGEVLGLMLEPFAEQLPGLIESVSGTLENFFGMLGAVDSAVGEKIAEIVGSILGVFVGGLATIITDISDALGKIFAYAKQELPEPLGKLADVLKRLTGVFTSRLPDIIKNVSTSFKNLLETFGKRLVDSFSFFVDLFEGLYYLLEPAITFILDLVGSISDLLVVLTDSETTFEEAMYAWGELVGEAVRGIIDFFKEMIDFALGIKDKIVSAFDGIDLDFSSIGNRIVEGIKQGISSAWNGLTSFVDGLWDSLFGESEKANEIHSPSRRYYRLARDLVDGIKLGWRDNFGSLQSMVGHDFLALAAAGNMEIPMARVDFADSTIGKSSAAAVNGTFAALNPLTEYGSDREINVNLVVDGRTLASVMYDPFAALIKQKGAKIL